MSEQLSDLITNIIMPITGTPTVWYCCGCSFGPFNATLDDSCMNCYRRRCSSCSVEKVADSLNTSSHAHCHETSPYPAAVNFHRSSSPELDIKPMLPAGIDLPRVRSLRPDLAASASSFSSFGQPPVHSYGGTHMYICCHCHDGPKVYNVQPRCINCNHVACSSCVEVK